MTIAGSYLIFMCLISSCLLSWSFIIVNNCPHTIWPGTLAGAGTPQLPLTGFQLNSGQSVKLTPSPGWSGRIWARTGCAFDETGTGKCQTGDCGGKIECNGIGATPPASLFEITLGKGGGEDYYDVSIVDGYNLPLVATPIAINGGCDATGCVRDLNLGCPKELQVMDSADAGGIIACKSACEAFGLDQYCCSGEFANPTSCRPSFYSTIFKRACPRAYSYAFDDGTSTFTCKAYDYTITFCPTANGVRRSYDAPPALPPPVPVLPPLAPVVLTPAPVLPQLAPVVLPPAPPAPVVPPPAPVLPPPVPALQAPDPHGVVRVASFAPHMSFRTPIILLMILNFL